MELVWFETLGPILVNGWVIILAQQKLLCGIKIILRLVVGVS